MRFVLFTVAISVAVSAVLPAQSPTLKTLSTIGVTVDYRLPNGKVTRYAKSIPANTAITGTSSVSAGFSANTHFRSKEGKASTTVTTHLGSRTSSIAFAESGFSYDQISSGQFQISTTATKPNQPHEWLLTVPANAKGNELSLIIRGTALSFAGFAIDVGNNGTFEVLHGVRFGSLARVIKLGTKTVMVRIVSFAAEGWRNDVNYHAQMAIVLNPRKAYKFVSYGTACGITLTGNDTFDLFGHRVLISAQGAFPTGPVLYVLGTRKAGLPLPGTNCLLHVNPLVVFSSTQRGLGFTIPDGQTGSIFAQVISLHTNNGYTNVRSSNGLEIDRGK